MIRKIIVTTAKAGLYNFTAEVERLIAAARIEEGLCTLFIRHTSASLVIQENADPTARADLENWLNRLVKENDPLYTHTFEGPDDMPSHIKAALTATSLGIPIIDYRLALGTWQGIYLWEHRHERQQREIIAHLGG